MGQLKKLSHFRLERHARMRKTILVIDDDKHLREGIRDILELELYTVFEAENGREGFLQLHRMPISPDLIICDMLMPRMDGMTFLKYLRISTEWSHIPLLMLAIRSERPITRLRTVNIDYLTKPFDAEDLLLTVNRLITLHRTITTDWNKR